MQQMPIAINGAQLIADLSGAVFWPAASAVIVADLHFEKGSAYAARGVALPPYDTAATLTRLDAVLAAYRPEKLVSLGDAFHDDNWQARMDVSDWARLSAIAKAHEMIWVTGNHDPTPPKNIAGTAYESLRLDFDGALTLRHEPISRHHAEFEPGELAGHLHPCGKIRQRGRNLRRRCFAYDTQRMILPAFGALTGSLNLRHEAFGGLFAPNAIKAVLLGESRLAMVAGKQLLPDRR